MGNRFYTAFDLETYDGDRKTDYRNAFQIDRDRIIHAQAVIEFPRLLWVGGGFGKTGRTRSLESA